MINPYQPAEDATTLFLERTFVAGDFLTGVEYGIQLVVYLICSIYLWNQSKARGKTLLYLLGYITLLLVVETIFCIVQAKTVQDIYVDNRNYPGGPWQYFLDTQNKAENVMFYASLFLLTFLSDLLVLWRCWVIWSASGRGIAYGVIAGPAIMLLASFGMGTLWTLQSSQPGLSLYSKLPLAYGTSYYAVSLSVNIILTILITIRILLHRRKLLDTLPAEHAEQYLSLMAMIIESAALYSVCSIIFIITYALNNPINQIFLTVATGSQQIAGYMIILRVAQGRAWGTDTTRKITGTMKFNTSPTVFTANANDMTGTNSMAFVSRSYTSGQLQTVDLPATDKQHITSPAGRSEFSVGTSDGSGTAWESKGATIV